MSKEVLKLALAFIEAEGWGDSEVVITAINQALAQQPAQHIPDLIHHTDLSETLEYITGWNDCRQAILAEQPAQQEPVGEAGTMPGTSGFTMACFKASDVSLGTKLYTSPQPAQQQHPAGLLQEIARLHDRIKELEKDVEFLSLPAQQEPVAFPTRKAVEREIERTANPTGMHLNDCKERVALPGGTLRHMLALIDRTSPPAQRTWVGLTDADTEHLWEISRAAMPRYHTFKTLIEKALKEKNT